MDFQDIFKIDLINLENDQRIPGLSQVEQFSLLTAWRVVCFIENCSNEDEFDCPEKHESQFRLCASFQHIKKVKDNLEDSLSNLFDIHFDVSCSLLSNECAEEYINEIEQVNYGHFYDEYLFLVRNTFISEQINNIITAENCDEMLSRFLNSSLDDPIKFLIIGVFYSKFEQDGTRCQFLGSLSKLAKKGVYAASFWILVFDGIDHADFQFKMQDHISLIKGTLSCTRMEVHRLSAIQYIFKLIATQAMSISKMDVNVLLGMAKPVLVSFNEHRYLRTINAQHAMICAIENNREDLMCFAYHTKLNIAAAINSAISGKEKGVIAALFEEYKISDDVLEYLKNIREIIKSSRILGEAYRTEKNSLLFFQCPQKELLYKIAAHVGNAKEGEMKEAMEFAQRYFSRPVM